MKLHGTKNLTRDHINKLITKKLNFLYFSKPIENIYRKQYRSAAAFEFRYRAPLVLILYAFLTWGVYQNISDLYLKNLWLSLYKWVGIIIFSAWLCSFKKSWSKYFDIYMGIGALSAVSITFVIINLLTTTYNTALLHAAMMYAVVIIYAFIGLRFYTAIISGWIGGLVGVFFSNYYNLYIDWTYLIHTYIFSSFLGMSLCYVIDRQHRENYLQNCIIEITQKEISDQAQLLEELSLLDPLTGLANRRYLNRILEAEWTLAIKQQEPISIIMLDIDYFKNYNDSLGHISGDSCLQSIAVALKSITNNHSEIAARYGGEEFLLVFPQTSKEKAEEIANLILYSIKNLEIKHPNSPICTNITVSLGVVTTIPKPNDLLHEFIEEADKKLYDAKKLGRNQYQISQQNNVII